MFWYPVYLNVFPRSKKKSFIVIGDTNLNIHDTSKYSRVQLIVQKLHYKQFISDLTT